MKKGFTLAEVLVTLGIIGVVAALAMPALNSAVQKTKVPPTLRKFIFTIENANRLIMQEKDADNLDDAIDGKLENYCNLLAKIVNGSIDNYENREKPIVYKYNGRKMFDIEINDNEKVYTLSDGSTIDFVYFEPNNRYEGTGNYKGDIMDMVYDINGFDNPPNREGKDVFYFTIDDNGSVLSYGSNAYITAYNLGGRNKKFYHWSSTRSDSACNESKVGYGYTCAGSIADNGWKIIYKY